MCCPSTLKPFAQGAQPPGAQPPRAQPGPWTTLSEYLYEEHGRYHLCPSSVRFNGRNACLGCLRPRDSRVLPSDLTASTASGTQPSQKISRRVFNAAWLAVPYGALAALAKIKNPKAPAVKREAEDDWGPKCSCRRNANGHTRCPDRCGARWRVFPGNRHHADRRCVS